MSSPDRVELGHGGGGQLTGELIERVILPALGDGAAVGALEDAADLPASGPLAMTTDSFVVDPLEFPGGDIGTLAVCGTVNDLAVSGAKPVALALSLVLEEGLELDVLRRVLGSAGRACAAAGTPVVTGDTKVIERRGGTGTSFTTTGVGECIDAANLDLRRVQEGDAVLLSGPPGEHGLTILSCRKGLSFSGELRSDCASVYPLARALIDALGAELRWMRDPTRGGVAATLNELAEGSGRGVELLEAGTPENPAVRAAAEMLGIEPLNAANEGKLVAVVAADAADAAVTVLRRFEIARDAAVIGRVGARGDHPLVEMLTRIGARRIVQRPLGDDLPRIC